MGMTGIDGTHALLKNVREDLSLNRKKLTDKTQLSERLEYEQALAGRQFAFVQA